MMPLIFRASAAAQGVRRGHGPIHLFKIITSIINVNRGARVPKKVALAILVIFGISIISKVAVPGDSRKIILVFFLIRELNLFILYVG